MAVVMTRQAKREAARRQRQERINTLRSYGFKVKDAKNQNRGEAAAVTKLWKKVKEFVAGNGPERFEFIPNKSLGKNKKAKAKAKKKAGDAGILGGIFVPKGLPGKKRITKDGEIMSVSRHGNLARVESILIPFDLERYTQDGLAYVVERLREMGWKDWTISPVFDGRPSASSYDQTTLGKELQKYILGNSKKGRELTGFLCKRVKVDRAKVLGAIKTAKKTAKKRAANRGKAKATKKQEKR